LIENRNEGNRSDNYDLSSAVPTQLLSLF
jgi:hypothetical protein